MPDTPLHTEILDQMDDAVLVADGDPGTRDLQARYANAAFMTLTGYDRTDLACLDVRGLFADTGPAGALPEIQQRLRECTPYRGALSLRRKDGALRKADARISPLLHADGGIRGSIAVFREIPEGHAHYSALMQMHGTDPMTGLANRAHLLEVADTELRRTRRYQRPFCLLAVDIDGFASINARFGVRAGDRALSEIGRLIQRTLRETDLVSRLENDTFAALLRDTNRERGVLTSDRLLSRISRTPIDLGVATVNVHASIGIAGARPDREETVEQIIQRAEERMRAALDAGGNTAHATDPTEIGFCGRMAPLWKTV